MFKLLMSRERALRSSRSLNNRAGNVPSSTIRRSVSPEGEGGGGRYISFDYLARA